MKWIALLLLLFTFEIEAQPVIDSAFRVPISTPFFTKADTPKVLIDEAHNNAHKKEGGLYAFTRMMEEDGARVFVNDKPFSERILNTYDVLIIVNALNDSNVRNWQNPCPSAFTTDEIDAIEAFVKVGGSLLFVADHMPYGGAAKKLAKRFDVTWSNSFVMQNGNHWPPSVFSKTAGTLLNSPITIDTTYGKKVSNIASFTGSAFKVKSNAIPFMIYDDSHAVLLPDIAWKFDRKTKNEPAEGWIQGACQMYGKGRIVFLGEAAMITAQLRKKTKIGMNSEDAPENAQLALNIFRYLATRKYPAE